MKLVAAAETTGHGNEDEQQQSESNHRPAPPSARLTPAPVDSAKDCRFVRMHISRVDNERPPICPVCGVTMVAAELSARPDRTSDWVCLECEETGESEEALNFG